MKTKVKIAFIIMFIFISFLGCGIGYLLWHYFKDTLIGIGVLLIVGLLMWSAGVLGEYSGGKHIK